MGKGHGKGSSFERELCKQLSLWWSYGSTNDIFWRTAGSGAMAKTRSKKGGQAFGQYGDVQATNPTGQKLIDICSIEIKRGYNKDCFAHILDKKYHTAQQAYEKFIQQATEDASNANARTWLLIAKRDRRQALVFMPNKFRKALSEQGSTISTSFPVFYFSMKNEKDKIQKVFGTTLDKFLTTVKPKHIKLIHDLPRKLYYQRIGKAKTQTAGYLEVIRDDYKEDQIFKCMSCDEDSVAWNGVGWVCELCGATNDYPK